MIPYMAFRLALSTDVPRLNNDRPVIDSTKEVPLANGKIIRTCDKDIQLNDNQVHTCALSDTSTIYFAERMSSDTTQRIEEERLGISIIRYLSLVVEDAFVALKSVCFLSRVDILSDSVEQLEYFYKNEELSKEKEASFISYGKEVYNRFLSATVLRLYGTSTCEKKKIYRSFALPRLEVHHSRPLTIRPKVPGGSGVNICIRHNIQFDKDTALALVLLFAISMFGPRILRNPVSRVLISISLGALLCVLLMLFFIARDLGRTTVGRIGFVSAALFGTISFMSNHLFHSVFPLLVVTFKNDRHLQAGSVITGLAVLGAFRYFQFERYIHLLAFTLLRLSQILLVIVAFTNNHFFSTCAFTLPILAYIFAHFISAMVKYLKRNRNGVACESFPSYVYHEAPAIQKMSSNVLSGTREEKMRKYELEGTIQTRKCLEKLGEKIRTNVSVVTRTNDPNTIAHWAGVS